MIVGKYRIAIVWECLEQTVFLCLCNWNDGAMTRCELTASCGVCHHFKRFEVGRTTELIVATAVAIVHYNPRFAIYALAYTHTFYRLFGLIYMPRNFCPLATWLCALLCSKRFGSSLEDATSAF